MSVLVFQSGFQKEKEIMPDEVLGGYCRGTCLVSEYLEGTAEGGK
jgi:hypothetical protein